MVYQLHLVLCSFAYWQSIFLSLAKVRLPNLFNNLSRLYHIDIVLFIYFLFGSINVERRDQEKYITVFHVVGIVTTSPYSIAY
jgi:uncharacterized membrane protein YoaT (DUF817 family)